MLNIYLAKAETDINDALLKWGTWWCGYLISFGSKITFM